MTTITKQRRALSKRLQDMRRRVIDAPREIGIVRVREVTNAIRNNPDLPKTIQFALGVKETLKKLPIDISDSELIVGKNTEKFKGSTLYPEHKSDGLIKELDNFNERTSMRYKITDEEKKELREDILPFWDGTSGFDKWTEQLDEETDFLVRNLAIIPFNDFQRSTGLSYVDYGKILEKGYEGIIAEAQKGLAGVSNGDPEAEDTRAFYKAAIIAAEGVIELAKRHARLASEMARTASSEERAKELREIAEICAQVPAKPARTFREAVQSFWFTFCGLQQLDMPMELPGARIDQYLYPFYQRDIQEGRLSREEAQELVDELFIRFNFMTDEIAKDLVDFTDELLLNQPRTSRGGVHVLSMHTEAHHIYQGSMVAASADGRHAGGEAMSPGCGPTSGMDKEGPTASMQSVCAMDFTKMAGGSSYNQRYSPKMFETKQGVQSFISLLKAYFFKLGGQHLQISTVDTETLRDAQKNPAKYEDLLVRVTGYSARFVELTEATQEEIISRSEICACRSFC
jgi:pyruvate-formate lyase